MQSRQEIIIEDKCPCRASAVQESNTQSEVPALLNFQQMGNDQLIQSQNFGQNKIQSPSPSDRNSILKKRQNPGDLKLVSSNSSPLGKISLVQFQNYIPPTEEEQKKEFYKKEFVQRSYLDLLKDEFNGELPPQYRENDVDPRALPNYSGQYRSIFEREKLKQASPLRRSEDTTMGICKCCDKVYRVGIVFDDKGKSHLVQQSDIPVNNEPLLRKPPKQPNPNPQFSDQGKETCLLM